MKRIEELQQLIWNEISHLPIEGRPVELYDPIRYVLQIGGKRMRPLLVLAGNQLCDGNCQDAIPVALGIELFHNFTLLHDDIMDNAPLRRGKPTVHAKYNTNTAILAGDVLFVIACQYISKADPSILPKVLEVFYNTAIRVCEGQQIDMVFEDRDLVSIDEYLEMIRLKTAVLLGAGFQLGAFTAKASDHVASELFEYGVELGMAFQLQDDLLDTFGNPEKFGKKPGGDIAQNKKTFLLLKAFEIAGEKQRKELDDWMNVKGEDPEKIRFVTQLFTDLNIPEIAANLRDQYFDKACQRLENLPLNPGMKQEVSSFAQRLLVREV